MSTEETVSIRISNQAYLKLSEIGYKMQMERKSARKVSMREVIDSLLFDDSGRSE